MMKHLKLAVFSLALLGAASVFARGNCGKSCSTSCSQISEACEDPKPCCEKQITVKVPVRKECKTYRHCKWVCDDPDAKVVRYEDGSESEEEAKPVKSSRKNHSSGRRRSY